MKVIVRDWLSANHVLFLGADENVLIDSGYGARVAESLVLLRDARALGDRPLARIINSHAHSDHVGGARHREWNAAFLRQPLPELATTLIEELQRSGAIRTREGFIRPV